MSGNEKRYFHIWWFLSFGKKFFTYYRGDVVGGGGNKSAFYNKETTKYLAKGDMKFIFKDQNLRECIIRFQSLMKTIKSTLKIYRQSKVTEKIGYTNLTKKQKQQAVKTGLLNKQDDIKKEYAYEDLENLINDSDKCFAVILASSL